MNVVKYLFVLSEFSMDFAISFGSFKSTTTADSNSLYCLVGPDLLAEVTIKSKKELTITPTTVMDHDNFHKGNALQRYR